MKKGEMIWIIESWWCMRGLVLWYRISKDYVEKIASTIGPRQVWDSKVECACRLGVGGQLRGIVNVQWFAGIGIREM